MKVAKIKIVAVVLMALTVAGAGAVGQRTLKPWSGEASSDSASSAPPKVPGIVQPRPANLQDLRDTVEQAEAKLNIKKAEVQVAKADLEQAGAQLAQRKAQLTRLQREAANGVIAKHVVAESEAQVAAANATVAAKRGALRIKQAELDLAEVQLRQAKRRLEAAEPPAPPKRSGKLNAEQRLRELEQRFDKLRRDFDVLKRQLRQKTIDGRIAR